MHNFIPNPILFSFGPIHIYWYGFFIVCGMLATIFITIKLAKLFQINQEIIIDLAFWLILGGIIGARIYDVLLELPFYVAHPLNIFKVWQGGLAIHGAIFAGLGVIWYYAKKNKLNFFTLAALITPGLALAQAIGRWGNYFNQELFGLPTNLPWGIFINPANRPFAYYDWQYFQPTFLYESVGCFFIFIILFYIHYWLNKNKNRITNFNKYIIITYLTLYSILRFSLEFIRIDITPEFWGLRWPQWTSLMIIAICVVWVLLIFKKRDNN